MKTIKEIATLLVVTIMWIMMLYLMHPNKYQPRYRMTLPTLMSPAIHKPKWYSLTDWA